jgi:hypothetical protein
MNAITPVKAGQEAQASAMQIEGELGELIRRDVGPLRKPQPVAPNADAAVGQVNSVIDRVSSASVKEIEKLIAELENLRDFVQTEGQRVQREISGYAQMSQSAMSSTKIMVESVAKWKAAIDAAGKTGTVGQ